jgi:glycosyltransferase involved in cell wall biosynthesis
MNQPLVSICIPVFNAFDFIEETINCFLNQSYKNIEIIVQDDCSTDGTWELLSSKFAKKSHVRLFKNDINLGIGDNWNLCYSKCCGDYVIIANADDIYNLNFIKKTLNIFLNNKEIEYVVCAYNVVSKSKDFIDIPKYLTVLSEGNLNNQFEINFFHNPFLSQFSIGKRALFEKNILKDGKLFLPTQVCDFELRLRFARLNTKTYFLPELLGSYRRHENNASSIKNAELKSFFTIIDGYHLFLKKNFFIKYFFFRYKIFERLVKDFLKAPAKFDYTLFINSINYLIK